MGFVANQPAVMGGPWITMLPIKLHASIRFCDCFGLPILTLVDVPAFAGNRAGTQRNHPPRSEGAVCVFRSYCAQDFTDYEKAYGGALHAMNSREMGADYVYAWPIAEIGGYGGGRRGQHRLQTENKVRFRSGGHARAVHQGI